MGEHVELTGWTHLASGKVRDIYAPDGEDPAGADALLMVTSDRISAYDHVLPTTIPGKGKILNQMAIWWMGELRGIVDNHLLAVGRAAPANAADALAWAPRPPLRAVPDADVVLVHDAARALTPPEVVVRVVGAVRGGACAVIPALPVADTVKEVELAPAGSPELVVGTPDRSRLRAVQTPQGFETAVLVAAHHVGSRRAQDEDRAASDDASLVEALGRPVTVVAGDPLAFKVTTPQDLALARTLLGTSRA